jgi:protocatechuate 4,5-dioxygenase alpha chain
MRNVPAQGYSINMFCMSLMKDENRKAFKANEADYLKKFKLTPEQTDAVLKRDYNRMLELGGNIYFTAKLGATDGHSFQHLAATDDRVNSQQDYADMMLKRRPQRRRQPLQDRQEHAVEIPFGCSTGKEERCGEVEAQSKNQS